MRRTFLKKSAALCLSTVMVLSLAVGCGSKDSAKSSDSGKSNKSSVSAEALIEGIEIDANSFEASLKFDVEGEIDFAKIMTGEDGEKTKVSLSGNGKLEADDDTTHADLTFSVDGLGEQISSRTETYTQKSKDTVSEYEYDSEDKTWYVSEYDYDEDDAAEEAEELEELKKLISDKSNFKSLKVEEKSNGYVVTAVLDYEKCFANADKADLGAPSYEDLQELLEGYGYKASDIPDVSVEILFDKDKKLKSLELKVDVKKINKLIEDFGSISTVSFKITMEKTSDVKVEVPSSVEKNAVEY